MSTDLQVSWAPNLFVDNSVFRLHQMESASFVELSGAAWITEGVDPKSAHEIALCSILRLMRSILPEYSHWLLACHSTWQNSNRITRHRKLWKSLKDGHGVSRPSGEEYPECLIEDGTRLRYFSAINLEPSDEATTAALSIVHVERASCIVAMPPGGAEEIAKLVASGWPVPEFYRPNGVILNKVTAQGGVVLQPVGAFDDFEAGVVAIAGSAIIELLVEH